MTTNKAIIIAVVFVAIFGCWALQKKPTIPSVHQPNHIIPRETVDTGAKK